MAQANESEQSSRVSLVPIFLIVLVDVLGLTIVFPLLPLYAESFGASAFVATLLVPTYAVCQILASPVLGALSDRHGRRPVLVASQAGTFIGFLMVASAPSLAFVFAGRALDGLTAGNLSVAQAYIADHTAPKDRARSFALIGIAFGLGFVLGPALAGYLSRYGLSTPLYLGAGLSFASIVCTLTLLREAKPATKPAESPSDAPIDAAALPAGRRPSVFSVGAYVRYFRRPELGALLGQFFLYLVAFSMFITGFPLFAERRYTWHGRPFTPHEIGWCFALAGVVGVMIQGGLLGRLVKRFGERPLIVVGLLALGVGYSLLAHVDPVVPLGIATIVSAVGNALLRPNLTSLITRTVAPHEHGAVLGVTQTLASLATIVAGPFSGWLLGGGHLILWSSLAGAMSMSALLLGAFARPRVE